MGNDERAVAVLWSIVHCRFSSKNKPARNARRPVSCNTIANISFMTEDCRAVVFLDTDYSISLVSGPVISATKHKVLRLGQRLAGGQHVVTSLRCLFQRP